MADSQHTKRTNGLVPSVGYIRMSSDKQEASPEQQRSEVKELADQGGYRILRWYTDEGVSGDNTEKRIQFKRMIRDAERKEFQAILCWDQDRFGRFDSIEAGRWIYPLRQNGVYLVTVAQGKIDWSDFAGRMLYGIQQEGKHAYLRDLSRNVCRGLRKKAKLGKWPSGLPPFGYALDEDDYLILGKPKQVQALQFLFGSYMAGNSLMATVDELTARRLPSPGPEWTIDAVKYLMRNENYTGNFVWGERPTGKYNHAAEEPIFIPNNHPAIIDRETFDACARRRKERREARTPKRNGGNFVLSGLLRCEKCGSRMYGQSCEGNKYLICSGYSRKGAKFCSRNSVREDKLLEMIIEAVEYTFLNPDTIRRLRQELRSRVDEPVCSNELPRLKRELRQVQRDLETARRNMVLAAPDLRVEYEQVFRDLRAQHRGLETEIKAASVPPR